MMGRLRGGASVPCPTCGANTSVVITRREDGTVIRRRSCSKNGMHDFQTVETVL